MSRSAVIGHPAELGDVITRPGTLRPEHIGPTLLVILMAGTAAAWLGYAVGRADPVVFLGEALGCWSVGLMSLGLVLMGFRRQLEGWFGGLDKVMRWHKRLSIAGVALLVPHIPMATTVASRGNSSPLAVLSAVLLGVLMLWTLGPALTSRIPRLGLPSPSASRRAHARPFALPGGVARWFADYDWWRLFHRVTVAAVGLGAIHGMTDSSALAEMPALRWLHVTLAAAGIASYVYLETLGRGLEPVYDYAVVGQPVTSGGVTELVLAPVGPGMRFVPGQFASLSLPGGLGSRSHPFTIVSQPDEATLRFSIKALGDFTSQLPRLVHPGTPVKVRGPFGRMDHCTGTPVQVWIAGGVGVTPFMSWLRSLDRVPVAGPVHFYYSVRSRQGDPFWPEILEIAEAHPEITARIIATDEGPQLSGHDIAREVGDLRAATVYLAGPPPMRKALRRSLVAAGLPRSRFRSEYFTWR